MPDDGSHDSPADQDEPSSDPIHTVGLASLSDPSGDGTIAAMVFVVIYEAVTTAVRAGRSLASELASRRRPRG